MCLPAARTAACAYVMCLSSGSYRFMCVMMLITTIIITIAIVCNIIIISIFIFIIMTIISSSRNCSL